MKRFASPFDNVPKRDKPARITSLEQIPRGQDAIMRMGASVIDLIPVRERSTYAYLRGASLGAAVYNLAVNGMLNTAKNAHQPHMHFANGPEAYTYANNVAESIAYGEGFNDIQFPASMQESLALMSSQELTRKTSGIIFALDKRYNDYILDESTRGAKEGVVWSGAVTLDMIDTRSRDALECIVSDLEL